MMDPNLQDAYEDDLKTIRYNKAIEAMIPVVKGDYCFFEGVVMDEDPDLYNAASENGLRDIHKTFYSDFKILEEDIELYTAWHASVYSEAVRRVEG